MENSDTHDAVKAGKEALQLDLRTEISGDYRDIPVAIDGHGNVVVLRDVLAAHDERAERPRRRRGTATLTELDSFIAHVNHNRALISVIFAHGSMLTAIYNYNPPQLEEMPPATAAWGDHRAVYTCPTSDELQAWERHNHCALSQEQLAKFLDEHFVELRDHPGDKRQKIPPCAALDLLELGEFLQVNTNCTYKRSRRRGEARLECTSEQAADSTNIPQRFMIEVPVFLGGASYGIEARLDFSIKENEPRFSFDLLRLGAIKREAFAAVRAAVAEKTGLPVFAGSPEA